MSLEPVFHRSALPAPSGTHRAVASIRLGARRRARVTAVTCLVTLAVALPPTAQRVQAQQASDSALMARRERVLSPQRLADVERFVGLHHTRLGLPGVAVAIAGPDSVYLAFGRGASTRAWQPITAETPFLIGSVTKTLTAALAARLVDQGRLDVDEPIETYLPTFTMRAPYTAHSISLRQLMQHRSGFSQWSGHDKRAQRDGDFAQLAPRRAPGLEGEYSSLNFIVLGHLLERAGGRPYAALLQDELLTPLGMSQSFILGHDSLPLQAAQGHQSWFGLQLETDEPAPFYYLVPAGFAAASANDLARFTAALLNDGVLDGRRIWDSTTTRQLIGTSAERPFGWGRRRERGQLILEHAGNARTSSARVRLMPEDGYAIVALTNTNTSPFAPALGDLTDAIHEILEGRRPPAPWPRERLLRGALLVGTMLTVAQLVVRAQAWERAGAPTRIASRRDVWLPLGMDLAGSAVVAFGVPRLIGVPLTTLTEYFPDMGWAMILSAGAGVTGGVLRAWTRSAR